MKENVETLEDAIKVYNDLKIQEKLSDVVFLEIDKGEPDWKKLEYLLSNSFEEII